jgi:hypothetical protein
VCSFNVRGLGSRVKRKKIADLVRTEKLDFLALQETKMEVISDSLVHNLWGNSDCCWAFVPSVGSSGGILSIWRKQYSVLLFSFFGEGFLGVCLDWGVIPQRIFLINIYSKCDLSAKRVLWSDILSLKRNHVGGEWCILGDFNSVRSIQERRGVNLPLATPSTELVEFNGFLEELELVDLPLLGRRFTWVHSNDISMSRIDRILVSDAWLDLWPNLSLWVLDRDISDHCPLLRRNSSDTSGPKPFRFCNHWLNHTGFENVVKEAWTSQVFFGWMGFVLKEKHKSLKGVIKQWHKAEFGNVDARIQLLIDEIKAADMKAEQMGLSEAEADEKRKSFGDLWLL